jgi:hypothetical protein
LLVEPRTIEPPDYRPVLPGQTVVSSRVVASVIASWSD